MSSDTKLTQIGMCSQCGAGPFTNLGLIMHAKAYHQGHGATCSSVLYISDPPARCDCGAEEPKPFLPKPAATPLPSDAAVLEAVRYFDDLRGEWSDEQLEVHLETLLDYARAETPRLTREQKESALHLLSEMDKMLGEDMQPDDERPAALAMQRFCAAFPELGE